MAFRRRRRGRSSGRSSQSIARRWTGEGQIAETTRTAPGVDFTEIVASTDYEQSATMEQSGVLLTRIRGHLAMRATIIGGLAFVAIMVIGDTETPPAPSAFDSLRHSELLWRWSGMVGTTEPRIIEIDVKAKRRLDDDRVVMVIEAIGQTLIYQWVARALLIGG